MNGSWWWGGVWGQGSTGRSCCARRARISSSTTLAGLLALTASGVEGLELNVLGLTFGLNPFDPAIKLPLIGRIGAGRSVVP